MKAGDEVQPLTGPFRGKLGKIVEIDSHMIFVVIDGMRLLFFKNEIAII